jgi:NSS family neurotransmitter:Na+ symporter
MMPIAALFTCLLVIRYMSIALIEEEVELGGHPFRRKKMFSFMIKYLCPLFVLIILVSSICSVLGLIQI